MMYVLVIILVPVTIYTTLQGKVSIPPFLLKGAVDSVRAIDYLFKFIHDGEVTNHTNWMGKCSVVTCVWVMFSGLAQIQRGLGGEVCYNDT